MSGHLNFPIHTKLEINRRYQANEPVNNLAEEYGCSTNYILRNANSLGGKRPRRQCALNDSAFSEATPAAMYWAGFLFADGSVDDNGTITIRLAKRDEAHLFAMREFLGSGHKIFYPVTRLKATGKLYEGVVLKFTSKPMAADLATYGVVPRKTWENTAPPRQSWDFWRGVIDGDGSVVCKGERRSIGLCGTRAVCDAFIQFCMANGIPTTAKTAKNQTIFQAWISGGFAVMGARMLYGNACCALERKLAVAKQLIAPC